MDLYLIVTEAAWDVAYRANQLMYTQTDGIDYEGGYFDVKLATLSYLDDAAERGDDPVRDSFAHCSIAWSLVDDLAERIRRAATPNDAWPDRAASFIAQVRLHGGYFLEQGHATGDRMLLQHAAVHLATAAARAVLAHNHTLFAGPKYLSSSLAGIANKPERFEFLLDELLRVPSPETAESLMAALEAFHDWALTDEQALSRFVLDNELAWRYRTKPPEYS